MNYALCLMNSPRLAVRIGVYLALMVLTLLPVEQRWSEADVALAMALPVVLAIGIALRLFSRQQMRMSAVDILVTVWIAYYIGRTWIGAEYPCRTEFLKTTMMFLLFAGLAALGSEEFRVKSEESPSGFMSSTFFSLFTIHFLLILLGCIEAIWGMWQLLTGSSRHGFYLMTGNFCNPGPYSAYLVLAAVIAIAEGRRTENKFYKNFCHTAAVMCLMVLPATWSRAAFVSLAVCLLCIYRKVYWRYRYVVGGTLIVLAVAFYYFKQGSADGRMVIWTAALTEWWHTAPWFGVGTGGFAHAFAEGMARLYASNQNSILFANAGVTDNAFNTLLKILVEQGIVGATLCLMVAGCVMWRLHGVSRSLFYGMLSLLIFSMFSYPFDLLPYKVIAVGAATLGSKKRKVKSKKSPSGFMSSTYFSLLTIQFSLIILSLFVCREVMNSYEADKEYASFKGMHEEVFLQDYYQLQTMEEDNAEFLFDFGMALRNQGRHNDSNDMLRRGTLVSADPMFFVVMGNNFKDMTLYNKAEECYDKAFHRMPNRLYPLYQKMQLFDQTGNRTKLIETAQRITMLTPKVASPATDEIKQKAEHVLQQHQKTCR